MPFSDTYLSSDELAYGFSGSGGSLPVAFRAFKPAVVHARMKVARTAAG